MRAKPLDLIMLTIIIIGAVNWGLIGFFRLDLIASIFGTTLISRAIYGVTGFAGLYCLGLYSKIEGRLNP